MLHQAHNLGAAQSTPAWGLLYRSDWNVRFGPIADIGVGRSSKTILLG
jgi:hypothetical protein